MGLAKSIVSGVAELSEQFGRVIVLEDDFVVSPDFLRFMLYGLDRYEHEESVYQLSGFMFPVTHTSDQDAFFIGIPDLRARKRGNRSPGDETHRTSIIVA